MPMKETQDAGSVPVLERSPGVGNSNPLQYSCLENSMNRGAWQATVRRFAKSWTQLSTHSRTRLKTPFHCFCTSDVSFSGLILIPVPYTVPRSLSVATHVLKFPHHTSLSHVWFCLFFHYHEAFPSVLWPLGTNLINFSVLVLTLKETTGQLYV